jgi:hypothetical protein
VLNGYITEENGRIVTWLCQATPGILQSIIVPVIYNEVYISSLILNRDIQILISRDVLTLDLESGTLTCFILDVLDLGLFYIRDHITVLIYILDINRTSCLICHLIDLELLERIVGTSRCGDNQGHRLIGTIHMSCENQVLLCGYCTGLSNSLRYSLIVSIISSIDGITIDGITSSLCGFFICFKIKGPEPPIIA